MATGPLTETLARLDLPIQLGEDMGLVPGMPEWVQIKAVALVG